MNTKSLLILSLLASFSIAATEVDLLEDILEALSDDYSRGGLQDGESTYEKSWTQANLLSALDQTTHSASGDLSRYWSGAAGFVTSEDSITDVQRAQLFIDTLTAKPHLKVKEIMKELGSSARKQLAQNALGTNDISKNSVARAVFDTTEDMINDGFERDFIEAFLELLLLEKKSLNCLSYWDGGSTSAPPPRYVIAKDADEANEYLNSWNKMPECNQLTCSVEKSKFTFNNQSRKIRDDVKSAAKKVKNLKCNHNNLSETEKNLCTKLQADTEDLLDNPSNAQSSIESYSSIQNLINNAMSIILLRFHDQVPSNGGDAVSFSSIYLPEQIPSQASRNDGKAFITNSQPQQSENLNTLIDSLAGLSSVASPIKPGLPINSSEDLKKPVLMIAGEFYRMTPDKKGLYRSEERNDGNYIWAKAATIDDAFTLRSELRNIYYLQRNALQSASEQSLLSKSSAADILNEVKNLNTTEHRYNNGRTLTSTQVLKEGSSWRLKSDVEPGESSWLTDVSTMSNVSLLRETAVLLAEMKQLLYLQLSNQQKSLLVQAITAASNNPDHSQDTSQLEASVENFASGSELSNKSPPKEPTIDDIQSQIPEF